MALDFKPTYEEIIKLIINGTPADFELKSNDDEFFGVQLTNFCSNDCLYCTYSRDNWTVARKRLTADEAVGAFKEAYDKGERRFILYGGLDIFFLTEKLTAIIKRIKEECPECELYVAMNEKVYEDYVAFKDAGADGFILPHRSINEEHFTRIHPMDMYPDFRKNVLPILREIGLKIGTGITVGWPYQTVEMLAQDVEFINELKPDLVVVDRFMPQKDTDFESFKKGDKKQAENVQKLIGKLLPDAVILTKLGLE